MKLVIGSDHAGFALKVGLPGLKAVGGREVDAFTLQAPDVIGKPEKVISAGREVGDGDQFGHRLIRSSFFFFMLDGLIDRGRRVSVPEPEFMRVGSVGVGER